MADISAIKVGDTTYSIKDVAARNALSQKEASANKVTELSEASTDTQYPSAKCVYDAVKNVAEDKHYTVRWDKVNAQMIRMNSAVGITTNTANFCHRGSKNAALTNPFDNIYPWSAINLCNISIDAYRTLAAGDSVLGCVTAWLGDTDFSYTHANGVWRYRPEFWYKTWDDDTYRYFDISPRAIPDYIYAAEAIEGRWHGRAVTLSIDGTNKMCLIPAPGMPGKLTAISNLHTYAKNYGGSVEDIYLYDANTVLLVVEYATMNTQIAVGNGVSDLYQQNSDTIKAAATASSSVKILKSANGKVIPGAIMDIGTANGGAQVGSYIVESIADVPDNSMLSVVSLTTDGTIAASITVTTSHMWSIHGLMNKADEDIGKGSGYIGTNGRAIAYYRGQAAHGNLWRYILGAYRQQNTGHIWISNSRDDADNADALNTSVHTDTGVVLPEGTNGAQGEGYIQTLGLTQGLGAPPFCTAAGGNSTNPAGDYLWYPALSTANTILIAGGRADNGLSVGRFYGYWRNAASTSLWSSAAVPVLKNP